MARPLYFDTGNNAVFETIEEFSLLVETKVAGDDVYASVDWEEISL